MTEIIDDRGHGFTTSLGGKILPSPPGLGGSALEKDISSMIINFGDPLKSRPLTP